MEAQNPCAVFYLRGFNEPYTEGHIVVAKNMIEALSRAHIRAVIFNFRYGGSHDVEGHRTGLATRIEHNVPLVGRETLLNESRRGAVVFSSLVESCGTLRFLAMEGAMQRAHTRCVVNVVNCFRYPRVLLKGLVNFPLILHAYMQGSLEADFTRLVVNKCDKVIASCNSVAMRIKNRHSIENAKVEVVYPPIDTAVFSPRPKKQAREVLGISAEGKIMLYIGSLKSSRFPVSTVLQSMSYLLKAIPETRMLIFAPMNRQEVNTALQISREARRLGLGDKVVMKVRNLSDQQKSLVYNASDVFLFPSLHASTAVEPPVTILESMASGLPVISSDACSASEVIRDGVDGYLLPMQEVDSSSIAEKAASILGDGKTSARLSSNARDNAITKVSLANSVRKLAAIYNDLL